ncbi:MAG: hypothetical protein AB7T49_08880 [Oligoflexales bacterium]
MIRNSKIELMLALVLSLTVGCDRILDRSNKDKAKKGESTEIVATDPEATDNDPKRIYYIDNYRVVRSDCPPDRPPSKEFCKLKTRKMLLSTFEDKLYEKRKLRQHEINRIILVYDEQIELAQAEGLDTTQLETEKGEFANELDSIQKEISDIENLLKKMQDGTIVYNVTTDDVEFPELKPYVQRFKEIFRSGYLVSAGNFHTCATDDTGMKCWGGTSWGGMAEELRKMEQVRKFKHPVDMVSGDDFACVLEEEGIYCFGSAQDKPSLSSAYPPSSVETYTKLYGSKTYICGVLESSATGKSKLNCDGRFATGFGINPSTVDLEDGDVIVTAPDALCIINAKGKGRCIDRASSNGYYPMEGDAFPQLFGTKQVIATNVNLCAIDDDGIDCWQGETEKPLEVPDEAKFPQELASYGDNICSVNEDKTVSCFGKYDQGETNVPRLKNTSTLSVGETHACALDNSGLKCWGAGTGSYGQAKVPDGLSFERL